MKRIIISFLSVFLFLGMLAQGKNEFTVKGTLTHVDNGTVILLIKQEGNVGMQVSSDTIRNGRFTLKWKVTDVTEKFTLDSNEKGFPPMSLSIWAKPGSKIEVIGNNKCIYTWDVKSNIPEQIERSWFIKKNKANWNKLQYLLAESATLSMENINSSDKTSKSDSLNILTQLILRKIALKEIEFLKQKPINTIAGMEVLERAVSVMKEENNMSELSALKRIYNQTTKKQKESREGSNISLILFPSKMVKTGDPIADGDLFDLNGNKHNLSDYKGKYILLDFWSNGCGACIWALPKLAEIYKKHAEKLNIVGINMDTQSLWKKRNEFHKITWINLNDKNEKYGLATKYGLRSMPLYVFLSPEGKILFSSSKWDELIKEMAKHIKD